MNENALNGATRDDFRFILEGSWANKKLIIDSVNGDGSITINNWYTSSREFAAFATNGITFAGGSSASYQWINENATDYSN